MFSSVALKMCCSKCVVAVEGGSSRVFKNGRGWQQQCFPENRKASLTTTTNGLSNTQQVSSLVAAAGS